MLYYYLIAEPSRKKGMAAQGVHSGEKELETFKKF
jgi:hypothetical protein